MIEFSYDKTDMTPNITVHFFNRLALLIVVCFIMRIATYIGDSFFILIKLRLELFSTLSIVLKVVFDKNKTNESEQNNAGELWSCFMQLQKTF